MKKVLLIALIMSLGYSVLAQRATLPLHLKDYAVKTEYRAPVRDITDFGQGVNPFVSSVRYLPDETIIGLSFYDLWSNTFIGNRFVRFEDGTMAGAWTYGMEADAFPDRGTGYNYFDGTAWGPQPTARIESTKTGWGHISAWGPNGEIVIAHNADNLEISRRENKGTGDWTEFNYLGVAKPTWPRHAVSGENNEYLHVIYHSYDAWNGQAGGIIYCRSTDGGDTWNPADITLDGTGADYYFEIQAETYDIDARGNTVVILVGGAWNDMFLMKSEDNGDTWNKIMIWEHPFPFFDFNTHASPDTVFVCDNSAKVALDANGMAHVVFGINRVLHEAVGTSYSYFPFVDGIGYWNETMPMFSNDLNALAPPQYGYATSEMIEDVNYIGYTQDVDGNGTIDFIETSTGFPMSYRSIGVSTMPDVEVDDDGKVYVVFASTTEGYDNFEWNYKKLWARAWDPVGGWGPFYHVTQNIIHIFDESIYPVFGGNSADNLYLMYQADGSPGTALDGDHDYIENRMYVAELPKTDVLTGIKTPGEISDESVSQNYPNPFNQTSTVQVNLNQAANLSLEVTNLLGQKVYEQNRGQVAAGTYYFQLKADDFQNGVYFYTVKAGNSKVTKKMIIE